ncbi:MAG TPA: hypothetical protein VF779_20355 [Pyrinomonadaceae bacterium]
MYQRLLGIVGVLWGGGIFLSGLFSRGQARGSGAYAAGQSAGWIFGLLLLMAGIFCLIKGPSKSAK